MKLFYSITEQEKKDLEKIKELRDKVLNEKITKEEFEREMDNLADKQLRLM